MADNKITLDWSQMLGFDQLERKSPVQAGEANHKSDYSTSSTPEVLRACHFSRIGNKTGNKGD